MAYCCFNDNFNPNNMEYNMTLPKIDLEPDIFLIITAKNVQNKSLAIQMWNAGEINVLIALMQYAITQLAKQYNTPREEIVEQIGNFIDFDLHTVYQGEKSH